MSTYRLPNFDYQYKLSLYGNFNNQLMAGHNAGLALYNYDQDTKLYKNIDYTPLDTRTINFDTINQDLDKYDKNYTKNDDYYHNARSYIAGVVDQLNKTTEDTVDNVKDSFKNLFNFDTSAFKIFSLLFLFALLLLRK